MVESGPLCGRASDLVQRIAIPDLTLALPLSNGSNARLQLPVESKILTISIALGMQKNRGIVGSVGHKTSRTNFEG